MKKSTLKILSAACFSFSVLNCDALNLPVWTQSIVSPADTAMMLPVKTQHDGSNNIYVLSAHERTGPLYKIRLNKYSEFGTLLWSTTYDNSGFGNPRGFDMAVDNAGDCYIAGAFMFNSAFFYKPLLLKINSSGSVAWMRDSTYSFSTGIYEQVILKNNLLYLSGGSGVAVFDLNGTELWSHAVSAIRMSVDNSGRMIVAGYPVTGSDNIFRYDAAGNLNFSDNTVYAERIACDYDNSFYLLSDYSGYELVKYDSSGIFQWSTTALPPSPPFGDNGFDVLVDYNNDVILVGLSDTMVKISPSGNLIWSKPMNGLDSYLISTEITFSNLIAVAGTLDNFGDYEMEVALFDLNGNQNWSGYYDGTSFAQEFSVDMTIDNSGIYVVENLNNNTTLAKFASPFGTPVDYSLVCVDSVWYDSNPQFINVRIFNGDVNQINYPSVQIVSPANDTIGNPSNQVTFFAQLGNTYQTYTDTITQPGITDFSPYTFLISEGFGDTTVVITWCGPVGISDLNESQVLVFPNPTAGELNIQITSTQEFQFALYNSLGEKIINKSLNGKSTTLNLSACSSGIYFYKIISDKSVIKTGKIIKQ